MRDIKMQSIKNIPTVLHDEERYYMYFAYGSNLNVEQMQYRCPKSKPWDIAVIQNHELVFRGNRRGVGVATVEPAVNEKVVGVIWLLHVDDLPSMDRYEGYPSLYYRSNITVRDKHDKINYEVMTYFMYDDRYYYARPSTSYIETIKNGYMDFGLNREILTHYVNKQEYRLELMEERQGRAKEYKLGNY